MELTLHHLALSCDELTLSVCGISDEEVLSLTFYDVRTFMNKVTTFASNLCIVYLVSLLNAQCFVLNKIITR